MYLRYMKYKINYQLGGEMNLSRDPKTNILFFTENGNLKNIKNTSKNLLGIVDELNNLLNFISKNNIPIISQYAIRIYDKNNEFKKTIYTNEFDSFFRTTKIDFVRKHHLLDIKVINRDLQKYKLKEIYDFIISRFDIYIKKIKYLYNMKLSSSLYNFSSSEQTELKFNRNVLNINIKNLNKRFDKFKLTYDKIFAKM